MKALRAISLGLAVFAGSVASDRVEAAPVVCPTTGILIAAFASLLPDGCDVGNDNFKFISSSLPVGATIGFAQPNPWSIIVSVLFPSLVFTGSASLQYEVAALSPEGRVNGAQVSALGGNVSVTKALTPGGSVTATGSPGPTIPTNWLNAFVVTDTYTIGTGGGFLVGFTNTFYVPEPATIGVLGLGLAGLGLAYRRRRRAA